MEFVRQCDFGRISALWQKTFGDGESFIRSFVDFSLLHGSFFGICDKGVLVSMLFMIDFPLRIKGKLSKGAYMYACATEENYRGMGHFASLYKYAENVLAHDGFKYIFCVPENGELFGFYDKFGFCKRLYRSELFSDYDEKVCGTAFYKDEKAAAAFENYRKALRGFTSYPIKDSGLFAKSLEFSDCTAFVFDGGYLAYDGEKIREIVSYKTDVKLILADAARFFRKGLAAYTLPDGNAFAFAAVKPLCSDKDFPSDGYANLLFE